jgi:hypothetical protein
VPSGALTFFDENRPLPMGWHWMPMEGGPGPYRVLFERLIGGTGTCFRPALKD